MCKIPYNEALDSCDKKFCSPKSLIGCSELTPCTYLVKKIAPPNTLPQSSLQLDSYMRNTLKKHIYMQSCTNITVTEGLTNA